MIMSFYCSLLVLGVLVFLFLLTLLLSVDTSGVYSREESSSYECGFEHHSLSRLPLSVRYFLLTMIFLVFDMEIILFVLAPFSLLSGLSMGLLVSLMVVFVVVLFLGLLYEWWDGALEWVM